MKDARQISGDSGENRFSISLFIAEIFPKYTSNALVARPSRFSSPAPGRAAATVSLPAEIEQILPVGGRQLALF